MVGSKCLLPNPQTYAPKYSAVVPLHYLVHVDEVRPHTSLNCGHQWAYCSFRRWYMSMERHGWMIQARGNSWVFSDSKDFEKAAINVNQHETERHFSIVLQTSWTYFFGESSQVGGIPTTRQVPLSKSWGAEAIRGRLGALRFRELATYALRAKWARRMMQWGWENIFASNVP
jgi:hypothetical protein